LRDNLRQTRGNENLDQKQAESKDEEEGGKESGKGPLQKTQGAAEGKQDKEVEEDKSNALICKRCGRVGHKSEDCYRPVICPRCRKEGHVARSCLEIKPWECIAPFCGLAAPELGFHIIQDDDSGDTVNEPTNLAVITIKEGEATARQVEGEFKAQAGPNSTWRWYAKKVADKKFQMKFPTASKVEELAFFNGMEMRTVPGVKFKVDKWNPHVGAKAEITSAWFRIAGIPVEKRSEKRVALVASLVGIPLEIDKNNLRRGDHVRVRIGCRDITKVPAKVEGLLDLHFYDFTFQREVQVEGSSTSWNTWTRNTDKANEDRPSPKKAKKGEGSGFEKGSSNQNQGEGDISSQEYGRRHNIANTETGEKTKEDDHEQQKNEEGSKEGKGKDKLIEDTEMENEEDKTDSDDSGPNFDDFMSPGGRHFTFGDFLKMRINERTVAIHEYGTNMLKYNYDPLAVIEAKLAMKHGKVDCGDNENSNLMCEKFPTKDNATREQIEGPIEGYVPTNPSPQTGTQEAPVAEWSSQEDMVGISLEVADITAGKITTQLSPNWEEVEEDTDKDDPPELVGDTQKGSVFVSRALWSKVAGPRLRSS
jgi:hypothetical protein